MAMTMDFRAVQWKVVLFLLCCCVFVFLRTPFGNQANGTYKAMRGTSTSFRLATFVADHMVLQRGPSEARIWGWASVGANVTAGLDGGDVLAFDVAGSTGAWCIDLPPQPAGAGRTLEISDGYTRLVLQDIAFGDVFLCSGQSNMEFTVSGSFNSSQEVDDAINYPDLRLATVYKTRSSTPQDDVGSKASYLWARSSRDSLQARGRQRGKWGVFSATCYYFGRELYKAMDGKVPVGLLASSWGGQRIETFSSRDALDDDSCGGTRPGQEQFDDSQPWKDDERLKRESDSTIWNGMVYPLLPMRISGVVWYQGEANAQNASSYACRFPAMITDWRRNFDLPTLAFLYVELAAFRIDPNHRVPYWPSIRAGQATALQLPGVGMTTAIDLGDPSSPYGPIHSRRKQEVGRRLALSMRALHYQDGDAEQDYSGPVFVSAIVGVDPAHSTAVLSFQPGTTSNLHLAGTADCEKCCDEPPFEILTVDRSWKRVSLAQIRNQDQVFLITNEPNVYGIRYAWQGQPECALYNGYGGPDDHTALPTAPFQWCAYPTGKPAWTDESCHVPTASSVNPVNPETRRGSKRRTKETVLQERDCDSEELRLPTFVDNHMVLQRTPHAARIWGWAVPGSEVMATLVEFGVQVATNADAQTGAWAIDFPPQPASDGHSIEITDGRSSIVLDDVAFGDVFLCSGQSNMEMTVGAAFNATQEIADSIYYPNLRLATVNLVTSDVEMEDAPSRTYYNWSRSSPWAVTSNSTKPGWAPVFSATCYFFGRELYRSMNGTVPIGLVVSSWGGQKVETFSSKDALADDTCGGTVPGNTPKQDKATDRRAQRRKGSKIDKDVPQETQLWNAMIHPLRHMRFAGALWYQGEANSADATSYACRFPAMIADWRLKFNLPDLTFLYVELAGYSPGTTWPRVRAAQAAALSLPHVGRATAIDLGDTRDAPHREIHPRRKQEVGRRLALTMRAIHYHEESAILNSTGPTWKGVAFGRDVQQGVTMTLSFEDGTAHGLYFNGSADCTSCCQEPPFQVLTESGKWIRADNASVMAQQTSLVSVTITNSSRIYGLRYAWEPRPECFLYNKVNFPASPLEWCVYPTGQPHWTNQSCALIAMMTTQERVASALPLGETVQQAETVS